MPPGMLFIREFIGLTDERKRALHHSATAHAGQTGIGRWDWACRDDQEPDVMMACACGSGPVYAGHLI